MNFPSNFHTFPINFASGFRKYSVKFASFFPSVFHCASGFHECSVNCASFSIRFPFHSIHPFGLNCPSVFPTFSISFHQFQLHVLSFPRMSFHWRGQHPQQSLHHSHQSPPRMRMMQVMLGIQKSSNKSANPSPLSRLGAGAFQRKNFGAWSAVVGGRGRRPLYLKVGLRPRPSAVSQPRGLGWPDLRCWRTTGRGSIDDDRHDDDHEKATQSPKPSGDCFRVGPLRLFHLKQDTEKSCACLSLHLLVFWNNSYILNSRNLIFLTWSNFKTGKNRNLTILKLLNSYNIEILRC